MKLFLISQRQNNGYDTYDSAVVAAETEDQARRIAPGNRALDGTIYEFSDDGIAKDPQWNCWATDFSAVQCKYLGEAKEGTKAGVICASFNAG